VTLDARTPGPKAARKQIGDALDAVRANARGLPREDAVHDTRVATRRLRAALRLHGHRRLAQETKLLGDALGALRDLQILAAHSVAVAEEDISAAASELVPALRTWRKAAKAIARANSKRRGRLGGHRNRERLDRRKADVRRKMRRVVARPDDAAVAHELRIAVKKLRYDAELLEDALGTTALLASLRPLQDALGDLHDVDVRLDWLGRLELDVSEAQREREARAKALVREIERLAREALAR
jgi:CHAD domain-containing protein